MSEKNILLGLLSKTHKKTKEELTELIYNSEGELKEDALSLLLDQDKTRIGTIKDLMKKDETEIYGKAQREILSKSEKQIKEIFGVKSDKKGDDLLKEIKTKLSEKTGNGDLTDEDVKNHALYQKVLTAKTDDIAKLNTEWELKLSTIEKESNQKNLFSTVDRKALAIAKGLNPILSKNPEKANKQLSAISRELKKYEFEAKGDTFIVKQNGKIVEDEHANQRTFNDIVKGITGDYFDLDTSQQRSGTGNDNNGTGASHNKEIKSMDEFREKIKLAKSPEERQQLSENFKKSQEQKKE